MAQQSTRGVHFDEVKEAARYIRDRLKIKDETPPALTAVVLGSGLGGFAQVIAEKNKSIQISYNDIPHFPVSSIEGHQSNLIYGFIDKTPVLLMQGRVHRYEGYSPAQVIFPVRVLQTLGIKNLILTNAAGAIGDHLNVGDLMLITDHINLTGDNPLVGSNDLRFGPRFFDMSEAYAKSLRQLARHVSDTNKLNLKEGVYAGVLGPCYETPAEIRMFKTIGADAVGMSTVFETIAARHGGIQVLGISCMTNKASGLSDTPLSHEEVSVSAALASDRFSLLLSRLIPLIS